jgi:hypothetical protein
MVTFVALIFVGDLRQVVDLLFFPLGSHGINLLLHLQDVLFKVSVFLFNQSLELFVPLLIFVDCLLEHLFLPLLAVFELGQVFLLFSTKPFSISLFKLHDLVDSVVEDDLAAQILLLHIFDGQLVELLAL